MHKNIALWTHPRSLSTAMERSFMERGDFTVFHEPFSYVYFMEKNRNEIPHKHTDPTHPRTYGEIKMMMQEAACQTPVFHKDMCYHIIDELLKDRDYLRNQQNTFLIRTPSESVLSYLTIHPKAPVELLGYEQTTTLFDHICHITGEAPLVIDAHDLETDPGGVLSKYCSALGIDYIPEALTWESDERAEWATWKEWHVDVAKSTGFRRAARNYTHDAEKTPQIQEYINYCMPYYEKMHAYRLLTD